MVINKMRNYKTNNSKKRFLFFIFIGMVLVMYSVYAVGPPNKITIFGNSNLGPSNESLLQGFLYGLTSAADPNVISPLKTQFWRIGNWESYPLVNFFGPKIEMILSDLYANSVGGYGNARPWENWEAYENFVKDQVIFSITSDQPIDYWDVWNEPDGTWIGTGEQLLQLFNRTHNAIRSVDPNAKIVAPSWSSFNSDTLEVILDYFIANNLTYNAISWHEFEMPEDVLSNVNSAQSLIDARPALGNIEIQINEFSSGQNHLIPGWTAGFLYYLQQSNVNWANRACWERVGEPPETSSECASGLDGLLLSDESTPQHIYWVHTVYSTGMVNTRISSDTNNEHFVALSTKDDSLEEVWVLVGRYSCGQTGKWCQFSPTHQDDIGESPEDVTITIKGYPYTASIIEADFGYIPNEGIPGPLLSPILLGQQQYSVKPNGNVDITLTDFPDGAVVFFKTYTIS